MSWSRTLGDLTTDVVDRVDVSGYAGRHPLETVRRRLIESYQRLREWMTDAGSNFWIGGPYLLVQTSPEVLDYGCSFPLKTSRLVGMSNQIQTLCHLRRVETFWKQGWQEVRRQSIFAPDTWVGYNGERYPQDFFLTGQGSNVDGAIGQSADPLSQTTSPNQDGQLRIVLLPYLGDGSCPVRMYGMPSLDIVDDYNTRLTLDTPGFDWLIYDAAIKLVVRDNDSQQLYQMLQNERAQAADTIRKSIARETSIPTRRRDVFATGDRYRHRRGF